MNTNTPKCDEASIRRITSIVNQEIRSYEVTISKPKRYSSLIRRKRMLIVVLALFSLSSLAFATNIDLPEILRHAYNQFFPNKEMADKALSYMQPLEGSSVFNGIKAELIGYIRDNDAVYLTFSLQDLEGDRLDETTFIYDYSISGYGDDTIDPYRHNSIFGYHAAGNILSITPLDSPITDSIRLVDYDAETKTATFNYRFLHYEDGLLLKEGNRDVFTKLELIINLIATGAKEGESSYDFNLAFTDTGYDPATIQADFDDFRRDGYSGYSKQIQTFLMPDEMRISLLNVPGVVISNYGIIDNRLHVLIKYERPRDVSINRILDMTLKISDKTWDTQSDVYLKDGKYTSTVCKFTTNDAYYAEYIFDLPKDYTAKDLEVLYHYRTYDYILGMGKEDFMSLSESEITNALWHLDFSPTISLEECTIPFKIKQNGQNIKELTGYLSPVGLMLPEPLDSYYRLYDEPFSKDIQLTLFLQDGTQKFVRVGYNRSYTKPDKSGKTKFLFYDFIDISNVKEIILTIP